MSRKGQFKIEPERIAVSYGQTGNIWKTANELGISGQTAYRRLSAMGIKTKKPYWCQEHDELLKSVYSQMQKGDGTMQLLMKKLGCSRERIEDRARRLGLAVPNRTVHVSLRTRTSRRCVERLQKKPMAFSRKLNRGIAGRRDDLGGQYFRSRYEANYARFLNFAKEPWTYEKKTFWFLNIKRGVRSYTPDFFLPNKNEFHEVKGWMDAKSKTKLKRMAKYYPEIKIVIVDGLWFKAANKRGLCRIVPGWECNHKSHANLR